MSLAELAEGGVGWGLPASAKRSKGHQSRSSNTNGKVIVLPSLSEPMSDPLVRLVVDAEGREIEDVVGEDDRPLILYGLSGPGRLRLAKTPDGRLAIWH